MSRKPVLRPHKVTKGTKTTKNHRFESFTERVSRLKIDPVRKTRREDLDKDDLDARTSHFKDALSRWTDTNLSECFQAFAREAEPSSESLAQILLFQQQIIDSLLFSLEKKDVNSLEPLLDLLANLARDLGPTFEPHFPRVLSTLTSLAMSLTDVEAIEWTFTCLAWLFKYLSRLLVPDLLPTYNVIAPLLGRETRKAHVARFAAQAMSFLVRKAAAAHSKSPHYLSAIVRRVLHDLNEQRTEPFWEVHRYGVMNLFAESMKGVNRSLNIHATTIFEHLLRAALQFSEDTKIESTLHGIVTNIIHNTDAAGFAPLLQAVTSYVAVLPAAPDAHYCLVLGSLLNLASGVRKGSRIAEWSGPLRALRTLIGKLPNRSESLDGLDKALISCLLNCPLDQLLHFLDPLVSHCLQTQSRSKFLAICTVVAVLDRDKFDTLLKPYFFKLLATTWDQLEQSILTVSTQLFPLSISRTPSGMLPKISDDRFQRVVDLLQKIDEGSHNIYICNGYLNLWGPVAPELIRDKVREALSRSRATLEPHNQRQSSIFLLGSGLECLLWPSQAQQYSQAFDVGDLLQTCTRYASMPRYLQNLRHILEDRAVQVLEPGPALSCFLRNLESDSSTLRMSTLELMQAIHQKQHGVDSPVLSLALQIEAIPIKVQSARSIMMHIRRFKDLIRDDSNGSWDLRLLVHYSFGLLTIPLEPAFPEVADLFKALCQTREGQEVITTVAVSWLSNLDHNCRPKPSNNSADNIAFANEFECLSHSKVNAVVKSREEELTHPIEALKENFEQRHKLEPVVPARARSKAIRLLTEIPHLVEKRSKLFIPIFLQWLTEEQQISTHGSEDEDSEMTLENVDGVKSFRATRKDICELLRLFSLFTNPKVLFKSQKAYDCLLELLSYPDIKVQEYALKAILTWKPEGVLAFQESLFNLLDDKRFREELTILFSGKEEGSPDQQLFQGQTISILLRLLYGRVTSKTSSTTNKASQATKRKAVFANLSRLSPRVLDEFLTIALGPLRTMTTNVLYHYKEIINHNIPLRRLFGTLNLIKDMLEILGNDLAPFTADLAKAVTCSCVMADSHLVANCGDNIQPSLRKNVRQAGLKCLISLFSKGSRDGMKAFVPPIFESLISRRLEDLPIESAQSIPTLFSLFALWARDPEMAVFLSEYDCRLLPKIAECLTVPSAKEEVKLFVLQEILKPFGSSPEARALDLDYTLQVVNELLDRNQTTKLQEAAIDFVLSIAPLLEDTKHAGRLLRIVIRLVQQSPRTVSSRCKRDSLSIVNNLLLTSGQNNGIDVDLSRELYHALSAQFAEFKDVESRSSLVTVFDQVAAALGIGHISVICQDLNSYSATAAEEYDFGRRVNAFTHVNELNEDLSDMEWTPIIYNMLYFSGDEEFSIRSSASESLKRYVESRTEVTPLVENIRKALMTGVSRREEAFSVEYANLMQALIRSFPRWDKVSDMLPLTRGTGDDDLSFFDGIFHLQQPHRLQAVRSLKGYDLAASPYNTAHYLLPLLENLVFIPDDVNESKKAKDNAQNLAGEAVTSIGRLVGNMEWPQVHAVLRRYVSYLVKRPDFEKRVVRLMDVIIETITRAVTSQDALDVSEVRLKLTDSLPNQQKLSDDIQNLLTGLMSYVRKKDDAVVSLRTTAAISVVRLLSILPPDDMLLQLPPLLIDVCAILKSRDQIARDMSRRTLLEISTLLGPSHFGLILRELKGALKRGYERHVLAFTMHALLLDLTKDVGVGDLDYCINQMIEVIVDDIFGQTGQEKDAEDYKASMKEIRSSKSNDSLEMIASVASLNSAKNLIAPLQEILEERLDRKRSSKADEALRRLGAGLLRNVEIGNQQSLVFCYEVLRNVHKDEAAVSSASPNLHKIARFALDLLRSIWHKFDALKTPANVSEFLALIGDALLHQREEIRISALRLVAMVIKVPLQQIVENANLYFVEGVNIIKSSTSTHTEAAQVALKLISQILKEQPNVEVKESLVANLIRKLLPDLDEPDRQGAIFSFLRAVLWRKLAMPEVYDAMDQVAVLMVTNSSFTTRQSARSVYFQFLLNYPQARNRLEKQLRFLSDNLSYQHAEGRESVLEAIHLLVSKVGENMLQDLLQRFFQPLVVVAVDDGSENCRGMAGTLLKTVFEKADDETAKSILGNLRIWIKDEDSTLLRRTGLQVFGYWVETIGGQATKDFPLLVEVVEEVLGQAQDPDKGWDMIYHALVLIQKLCTNFPTTFQVTNTLASLILRCLGHEHSWVRVTAAELFESHLLNSMRRSRESVDAVSLSDQDISELVRQSMRVLRNPVVDKESAEQLTRLLLLVIRSSGKTPISTYTGIPGTPSSNEDSANENSANEDSEGDETLASQAPKTAIQYILYGSALVLRRQSTTAPELVGQNAALKLMSALLDHADSLDHATMTKVLVPLVNLTDPSIPRPTSIDAAFTNGFENLATKAEEVLQALQKRLGTTDFVRVRHEAMKVVKGRREGRRIKRRLEAVSNPERRGSEKRKKVERKKEKRREKSQALGGRRRGW